jgi:hypothetical protein
MAAAKGGTSTAQRVDAAWKALVKYRKDFGIPQVHSPDEVAEEWCTRYDLTRQQLRDIQAHVRTIVDGLGNVPWKYEAK